MWKVKRMNPARIAVLAVAIVAGGIAAYLASGSDDKPAPVQQVAQLQTVDVLVAKNEIGLGQSVKPDDLQWQTWPAATASGTFIKRTDRPEATKEITGSIARSNGLVIFINQIREKIGVMFGSPETTTGGRALKFYSSVRIDIRRIGQIKDGEEPIGARTKATVVKNKVAPPFKKCEFDILFAEGINRLGEILDIGVETNFLKRSGTWISHGETRLGQGREKAREFLKENPALAKEIEDGLMAFLLKRSAAAISSKVRGWPRV